MRFHREVFLNAPAETDWLRSTHLAGLDVPAFSSFVLAGNEDGPARLDLYKAQQPAYNEHPVAVVAPNADGVMEMQGRP